MPLSMKFRYEVGKMDKGMFQNNGHLDKFKQSLRQGAKKYPSENKTPEVRMQHCWGASPSPSLS